MNHKGHRGHRENLITLKSIEVDENISFMDEEERLKYQKIFGYGYEDLKINIYEMAQNRNNESNNQ